MLQDLRYALRTLLKTPSYSAIAVLVIALGIGANAAIFSFVDAMLLRPLPYPNADRLYAAISMNPARGSDRSSISYADYEDWKRERDVFESVALVSWTIVDLTGSGEPERITGLLVSSEFFTLTAPRPVVGRTLQPEDHAAKAPRVTVISHSMWQRRFGGAADVVGTTVRIGGVPTEIVGVLPPRATWPEDIELFVPMRTELFNNDVRTRRDNLIFQAIARLADGTTREQAEARMRTIAARLEREFPESRSGWTNGLLPLREYIVEDDLRTALFVLLAAVAAVLLIGCANLASLALVRGAGRMREIGVRLALGASRGRLVRQLLAESLLLAVAGGLLGIALASLLVEGLRTAVPPDAPFLDQVGIDTRVLIAAALMSIFTALLFGILPAITSSGVRVADSLKEGSRGSGHSKRAGRMRSVLVVGEIAAAVVLLVAASLLVRSLTQLTAQRPAVDLDRVLAGQLALPGARYPEGSQRAEFVRQLTSRLASETGVASAAVTTYLPVGAGGFDLGRVFLAEGWPEPPAHADVPAQWIVISPDYFRTLGVPLVRGRVFEDRDNATATQVIIVSETFARRAFGDDNPLGRRVRSWRDENIYREIVGVVADVPFSSLADPTRSIVYIPHQQNTWGLLTVVVRAAAGPPDALAPILRRTVASLDPDLALAQVGTMSLFARDSIARERLSTTLMSALALAALVLAALGIYGVMSHAVAQRRQEMGLRLALGASPGDLYRAVLARGLTLTATGLTIGLVLAIGAARLLRALLFETSPFDPLAFASTAGVLLLIAVVACVLPARRAAAADPLVALRSE
jgi:putative ABC transport system permease protein